MFPRTAAKDVCRQYFSGSSMYKKEDPPEYLKTLKLSHNKQSQERNITSVGDLNISREVHKIILNKRSVELLMSPFSDDGDVFGLISYFYFI